MKKTDEIVENLRRCVIIGCLMAVTAFLIKWFYPSDGSYGQRRPEKTDVVSETKETTEQDGVSEESAAPASPEKVNDWRLILVNSGNYLPEDFEVELELLRNGQSVDKRCYPELQRMMDDCRAQGLEPLICSSYRSVERQEELFAAEAEMFAAQGYSEEEARSLAAAQVALPRTSEHHTGLALDIVDANDQILDDKQADTPAQKWLMENCFNYGFILRYPAEKQDITGIIYEPWHYRYVGEEAAREIHSRGLCLEEYLAQYYPDTR